MTRRPHHWEPSDDADQKLKRFTRLQLAYISWLKTLGNPTHAVTLTFKRHRHETKQLWNISIIKDSLKVFLSVLNRNVFGKHAKKTNQCVMSAVVIGTGAYNDHPHAHLALEKPADLSWDKFTELIFKAIETTSWIDGQSTIELFESDGWLEYMVEHGEEDLLIDLCTPARP